MTGSRKHRLQRQRAIEKARQNRDTARAKLLAQHRTLAACRRENRRRMADVQDGDDGPHSTVPPIDTEDESATGPRHSTVPRRPAGSDDDPPERLYGIRLRNAAEGTKEGERDR